MSGDVDQNALSEVTVMSSWDSILADTHIILTDPDNPDAESATAALLVQVAAAVSTDATRPVVIARGWPSVLQPDASAGQINAWQIAIAASHAAWLEQLEAARAAFPQAVIQPLDLAGTLADLFSTTALEELSADTFFTVEEPGGTEVTTSLAALIVQMAQSEIPVGPPEDIAPQILDIYDNVGSAIWTAVGASLGTTPEAPVVYDFATVVDVLNATASGNLLFLKDREEPAQELSFLGTDANDTIAFSPDLQNVDGGAGTDTLVMDTAAAAASITEIADGTLQVQVSDSTVTLQNVERIEFTDGHLAFDDDGIAGQAYRLYQACFDRVPDAEGLGFWIRQIDAGNVTLQETAGHFLASEEFATVYGNPAELADIHYLALLYANVLGRAPDAEGFDFWRTQQENGITRADMLVYFSESAENIELVANAIDDGIWYL
jgi:hypothetical protein